MQTIKPKHNGKKITVVGSINSDMTSYISNFPASNQTILAQRSALTIGGKGLNQAVAAAQAGGSVHMIACVGRDVLGDMALRYLEKNQVNTACIKKVEGIATGTANIMVTEKGDNMIAVAAGANSCLLADDILRHKEVIQSSDILIVQLEVPYEAVAAALKIAAEAGVTSILNPAPALEMAGDLLALADIITPNETEVEELVGIYPRDAEAAGQAVEKLRQRGAKNIIITMGEAGYFYAIDEKESFVSSFEVDMVDPTGAGDVFNGVLAVALAREEGPLRSAQYASAAGALSVMKAAAEGAAPSWAEIEGFLEENMQA